MHAIDVVREGRDAVVLNENTAEGSKENHSKCKKSSEGNGGMGIGLNVS